MFTVQHLPVACFPIRTILNQLPINGSGGDMGSNATAAVVLGNSAWQFCAMFFGSALLGVGTALISALVRTRLLMHCMKLDHMVCLLCMCSNQVRLTWLYEIISASIMRHVKYL